MHEQPTQTPLSSENQAHREELTVEAPQAALPSNEVENTSVRKAQIQTLNDLFRKTFLGGTVCMTNGVQALGAETVRALAGKIQSFSDFTKDNDPYGEHDFGIIKHEGQTFYWKIDYYNKAMTAGSEDSSDPKVTSRVLTIMQNHEY